MLISRSSHQKRLHVTIETMLEVRAWTGFGVHGASSPEGGSGGAPSPRKGRSNNEPHGSQTNSLDSLRTCSRFLSVRLSTRHLHSLSHSRVCVFVGIYKPNKSLTDCLMSPGTIRTVLHLRWTVVMVSTLPLPLRHTARKSAAAFNQQSQASLLPAPNPN